VLVALVLGAGPARAATTVNIDSPADGAVWDGGDASDFHVKGLAQVDSGSNNYVIKVTVNVDSTDAGNHHYNGVQDYGSNHASTQPFDITVLEDGLKSNGAYKLTVTAFGHICTLFGCNDTTDTEVRNIVAAAPPAAPKGVKATLNGSVVKIEWSTNIEEDDLGYLVHRAKGTGTFSCVGAVEQKNSPAYSLTDDLKDEAAGDYKYRVVAYRRKDSTSTKPSCQASGGGLASPATTTSTIAWGPATTTTTVAGGPGATTTTTVPGPQGGLTRLGGGAGGSTSAAKASKKPNLSGLSGLAPVNNMARNPKLPAEADPGFNELLPFQPGSEQDDQSDISGLPSTKLPADSGGDGHTTTLLFIAAGLLVTVLSAHVLWLKAQVDRMPLEALTPEELPLT
jgi:hypothetical protein